MPAITVPLRAPELVEGTWIQGPRVSLAFSRGAVVLVDFWESTCINCLRTLPYLKEWHRRYGSRGLVTVGIHTPEFEFARNAEVVAQAVEAEGIPYPVLLDSGKANWQRFANHFWPAKYLIDSRGYLRYEHFGEGAYGEIEEWIQRLMREAGDLGDMPEPLAPLRDEDRPGAVCHSATPEVYVGYHRGRLVAPAEGYRPGEEVRHPGEECIPEGMFTARGLWFHEAEYLEAREAGAELELLYRAASVGAVLEPTGEVPVEVEVRLDGEAVPESLRGADLVAENGRTVARWERPRLVQLIGAGKFGEHRLRLRFLSPGARVYAFSFTSCVAEAAAAGASKS